MEGVSANGIKLKKQRRKNSTYKGHDLLPGMSEGILFTLFSLKYVAMEIQTQGCR
jgi:hypothetical protein